MRRYLLLLLYIPSAFSTTLMNVYRDALLYDQQYKSAVAVFKGAEQNKPIAYANVLPTLSYFAELNANHQFQPQNFGGARVGGPSGFGRNYTLSLSQPLFQFDAWYGIAQANATVKAAYATFLYARQEMIIRAASAYFAVLKAQDDLRFTKAEKRANSRQLAQARERYKVGLDAITSVYEAQASYDGVVAQEIAAQNALDNSKEALRAITGKYYTKLSGLRKRLPLLRPDPDNVNTWTDRAVQDNYLVKASQSAAKAAKAAVDVAKSGHYPSLSARGELSTFGGKTVGTPTLNGHSAVARLQLSLPIYAGGSVVAKSRQASQNHEDAMAQYEEQTRQTVRQTRQSYNSVVSGISKIKADRQAVVSANSSLDSTQAAVKVGTRTIVDLLAAQRDLYNAQRALAADQYQYINDTLLLKQAAGRLGESDLKQINGWLSK